MGTETRIGIATGLVIVVVASVYFFYGSDRSEEDLLMVSGTPFAEVPAVPPGAATRDPSNRPNVKPHGPRVSARKAVGGHRATPPANNSRNHRVDTAARPASGRPQATDDTRVAAVHRRPPTQLRSEPSSILIDATRKNLDQSPTGPKPKPANAGAPNQTQPRHAPETRADERKSPPKQGARRPVEQRVVDTVKARPAAKQGPATGPLPKKTAPPIQQPLPTKPVAVWPRRHTVVSGDTLSGISARYYGTSRAIARILEANAHVKNPRSLRVGHVLVIPAPSHLATAKGGPAPKLAEQAAPPKPRLAADTVTAAATTDAVRTYRVRPGDSFCSIALRMYGRPGRWKDVYNANRGLVKNDPKRLRPGMMLRIP